MFSKSDIQNKLQEAFNTKFESLDFVLTKHSKYLQYKKTFHGGFQSCIFTVLERNKTFWIEINIGVRIDIVEKLANQFTLTLKDYHNESQTVTSTYGRIMGQPYFRFKVQAQEELELAFEKIDGFLAEIAFDFMEDNSQVAAVDKLINRYPEKPSRFMFNESHRCIKGIIIARMADNPQLPTLIKAYKVVLQRHSLRDKMLPQYQKLVDYLSAFSVN
ncbi:MAG: hypothetical protein ACPG49_11705 [Chitinophagales bacterium]